MCLLRILLCLAAAAIFSLYCRDSGRCGYVDVRSGQNGQAPAWGCPRRVRDTATGLNWGLGGGLGSGGALRLPHSQFCQIQRPRRAAPQRIPRFGQRRQGSIIARHARRRSRAVHQCGDRFCACVGAATARTKFAGETRQTAARNLGEKERALFNARDRFT